ncbi:MAG: TolC family protein, partial [Candidatus Bathyarchaeia archaeon]
MTGCRSLVVNPQSGGEALPFSQLLLRQEQDAQSLLQNHLPLQLSQAILWAKERNHRLLRQKIRQELSHIQKQAALEPFLPNIQVQWSRQGFRKDPLILMNGIPIMTQDRYVNEWIYQVQQAIFAPQAYYAYRLRSHQEELEKVLYEIQERGIVVGVIQSYVILWSLTNQIQMVEKEIHYLSQLLQDTQVAEKVGIRLPLDTQLVHYQIQSKQYEHQQLRREYEVACGELLELLGFPATPSLIAQIQIAPFSDQDTSQFHNSLPSKDEGILTALKHRLEINISDFYLQQAEDQIRLALSEFLPTLGVQAVYTRSTNSFLKYADNMLLGVGAFLSVFQGFRSIQDYRAALRVRHETMVLREVQCL